MDEAPLLVSKMNSGHAARLIHPASVSGPPLAYLMGADRHGRRAVRMGYATSERSIAPYVVAFPLA